MNIEIIVKPDAEFDSQAQSFTSFDEAIDYLKEWRAAVQSTTQMDDAVAVMNF